MSAGISVGVSPVSSGVGDTGLGAVGVVSDVLSSLAGTVGGGGVDCCSTSDGLGLAPGNLTLSHATSVSDASTNAIDDVAFIIVS